MVNLEDFIRETIKIRANKTTTIANLKEAELLLVIEHNFTKSGQKRFKHFF